MLLSMEDPRRDAEMKEICARKITRLEIQRSMIQMDVNHFGSEISISDLTELIHGNQAVILKNRQHLSSHHLSNATTKHRRSGVEGDSHGCAETTGGLNRS
jgi:histidyl-tRNA synthetase